MTVSVILYDRPRDRQDLSDHRHGHTMWWSMEEEIGEDAFGGFLPSQHPPTGPLSLASSPPPGPCGSLPLCQPVYPIFSNHNYWYKAKWNAYRKNLKDSINFELPYLSSNRKVIQ